MAIRIVLIVACVLVAIWLVAALFIRSFSSRKYYRCPHCGEKFRVELMDASHCNSCGAPIEQTGGAL